MLEMLAETRRAAAECAAAPGWAMSDRDVVECLVQAWAGVQQLTAVVAHLIRQAQVRDLPRADAATSTVVWLRQLLRVSPAMAARLAKLARVLDARPALDNAVCAGAASAEQAAVIAAALADLPAETGGQDVAKAESMLLGWADDFDPPTLGRLGARILAHVAPEVAEQREADLIARQEAQAHRKRAFTISAFGAGQFRLSGWLDAAGAATVNAALDPLCHPRRDDAAGSRTPAQRRADALVDVCAGALRGEAGLPGSGGDPAQVVVTVPFTALTDRPLKPPRPSPRRPAAGRPGVERPGAGRSGVERSGVERSGVSGRLRVSDSRAKAETVAGASSAAGAGIRDEIPRANTNTARGGSAVDGGGADRAGAGVGWLDTGAPISAAEARRIACDAQILPAVLGGDSQVLDLGRARRLFTGPIRRALILRDRGCTFAGCDRPARWSEGHHIRAWADGGPTDLANACLVCRRHHRLLHDDSGWHVRLAPDGHPEYLPPTTIDPQQHPRRNTYHQRQ